MLHSLKVPLSNKYTTGNNVIQILIFQMKVVKSQNLKMLQNCTLSYKPSYGVELGEGGSINILYRHLNGELLGQQYCLGVKFGKIEDQLG